MVVIHSANDYIGLILRFIGANYAGVLPGVAPTDKTGNPSNVISFLFLKSWRLYDGIEANFFSRNTLVNSRKSANSKMESPT